MELRVIGLQTRRSFLLQVPFWMVVVDRTAVDVLGPVEVHDSVDDVPANGVLKVLTSRRLR